MSLELDPMTPEAYTAFVAEEVPAYAAEKVVSGEWQEAESVERARRDFAAVLPQGLATPGHHLFTLRDAKIGASVGMIWIALRERAGRKIAYVYNVRINSEYRRQGYATRAFSALEQKAPGLGFSGIQLHVFGHNRAAATLYEKIGFQVTDLHMFKPVGTSPP